ncbi:hypothetical protein CMK12_13910 [Candidatus Poribacteria bacterium]|nr:hypothetical protein [Candidatus Poribacteria bacterium]MDP6597851.1 hypothetical protein [Candidatus Poribacteria bacterium]MDP6746229.1 hypothetical protein [Candidatus Poribacteria bacterium]MDP6996737.1 hypothetical protein [Candidatus Poribacteria bacterium]
MISWAGSVCFFSGRCNVEAIFVSSFHRLLADIYSHPLDVGLAFKQLFFTGRRNGRYWINLFSTGCIVRPTVDWLTASAGAM